jgi:hypothetical protein
MSDLQRNQHSQQMRNCMCSLSGNPKCSSPVYASRTANFLIFPKTSLIKPTLPKLSLAIFTIRQAFPNLSSSSFLLQMFLPFVMLPLPFRNMPLPSSHHLPLPPRFPTPHPFITTSANLLQLLCRAFRAARITKMGCVEVYFQGVFWIS